MSRDKRIKVSLSLSLTSFHLGEESRGGVKIKFLVSLVYLQPYFSREGKLRDQADVKRDGGNDHGGDLERRA